MPHVGEFATLGRVLSHGLEGNAKHHGPGRQERDEADDTQDDGGHDPVEEVEPGAAARQPHHGAKHHTGEDQSSNDIEAPVVNDSGDDAGRRKNAAQDEGDDS